MHKKEREGGEGNVLLDKRLVIFYYSATVDRFQYLLMILRICFEI